MALGRVTIPTSSSFEQTAKILNDLVPKMKPKVESLKEIRPLAEGLTNVLKRFKFLENRTKEVEKIRKEFSDYRKRMNELKLLKKEFAEAKKKLSPVYKTVEQLKKGLFKEINPKLGQWMGVGTGLLSLEFTTFLIKKNEEIQEIELRTADVRDAEFDKIFQRSLRNSS